MESRRKGSRLLESTDYYFLDYIKLYKQNYKSYKYEKHIGEICLGRGLDYARSCRVQHSMKADGCIQGEKLTREILMERCYQWNPAGCIHLHPHSRTVPIFLPVKGHNRENQGTRCRHGQGDYQSLLIGLPCCSNLHISSLRSTKEGLLVLVSIL